MTTHRLTLGLFWICLAIGMVAAQERARFLFVLAAANPDQQGQSSATQQNQPQNPNAEFSQELAKTSEEAAKEAGIEDAKVAMELKAQHSPIVTWIGRLIKISPESAYLLSLLINFGILVGFFWMLLKAKVPQMFRDRTAIIQKGIREAQAASAEAARRLQDIEARLAKLDTEVAEIRASAEKRRCRGRSAHPPGCGGRQAPRLWRRRRRRSLPSRAMPVAN